MTAERSVRVSAPAKVNLYLRVLGAREDGFHDIETLFQGVSLHDDLEVTLTGSGKVDLSVEGIALGPPEENLVFRAARRVLDAVGSGHGVRIRLLKRIPAGGGLGGGSSDAAATLRCVNDLLGAPLGGVELVGLAEELGSDVPFFLGAGPFALARGRGEALESLTPLPEAHLVLVLPAVHVATAWAYRALDEARARRGEAPRLGLEERVPVSWGEVAALATNDFQDVVAAAHPPVAHALATLRRAGGAPVLLSGSGAACFGVFADGDGASEASTALGEELGCPAVAARTLVAWPTAEVA